MTKLAFEFLVLTVCRSGEVRLARWSEVDLDAAFWEMPGERMKSGRPHRVPLSGRAVQVLGEALVTADGLDLLFLSVRGKPMSNMTLLKLSRDLNLGCTPHGFRSSFRDWCSSVRTRGARLPNKRSPTSTRTALNRLTCAQTCSSEGGSSCKI